MWLYREGPYRLGKERPERYVIMCVAIQGGAVQAEQRAAREVCYNVYGYTGRGRTSWVQRDAREVCYNVCDYTGRGRTSWVQREAREVSLCYNVYGYTRRGPTGWAKSG